MQNLFIVKCKIEIVNPGTWFISDFESLFTAAFVHQLVRLYDSKKKKLKLFDFCFSVYSVEDFFSMEGSLNQKSARKRKLCLSDEEDGDIGKVYKFKILLSNGMSVELTLQDPDPEMPLGDFVSLVKDKYLVARKGSQSVKKKRDINWKSGKLFLQDVNDVKIKHTVKFKNYKPHKCHILRLHVSIT